MSKNTIEFEDVLMEVIPKGDCYEFAKYLIHVVNGICLRNCLSKMGKINYDRLRHVFANLKNKHIRLTNLPENPLDISDDDIKILFMVFKNDKCIEYTSYIPMKTRDEIEYMSYISIYKSILTDIRFEIRMEWFEKLITRAVLIV